jgi:tellurite resistance protein TerC
VAAFSTANTAASTEELPVDTIAPLWLWTAFAAFVVVAVLVDLFALNRQGAHAVTVREALSWSALWVALALVFNGLLWFWLDQTAGREIANARAGEFLTGYLIEKSLSVDNIFVFLLIFNAFAVPAAFQKRVLVIGVVGAIVLRVVMILIGAWLISRFHWILYVFGAFLIVTGIRMIWDTDHAPDLEKNWTLRWLRNHLTITDGYRGESFLVRENGIRAFTPLFLVVALIAVTDVIFAVDSIPAIFAVTTDPFIVMTSNIFAILGLRALYFLLADMASRFHLLSYGLAAVLMFVGTKMLIVEWYKIPIGWALATVVVIIGISIAASLLVKPAGERTQEN